MLLKDYHNPDDFEKDAAFREIYHFIQGLTRFEKILVWLMMKIMGDKLFARAAQRMHSATMVTLQDAAIGVHQDFFKRKRKERAAIRRDGKRFIQSTDGD